MSSRSGSNRSAAERSDAGRPVRQFCVTTEVDEEIGALSRALGISRSAVVCRAVELLSHTVAPKSAAPDESHCAVDTADV